MKEALSTAAFSALIILLGFGGMPLPVLLIAVFAFCYWFIFMRGKEPKKSKPDKLGY